MATEVNAEVNAAKELADAEIMNGLQSFYGGRCGSSRSGGSRKAASRASPITTSISSTTTS